MKTQIAKVVIDRTLGILFMGTLFPLSHSEASLFSIESSFNSGTYTYSFTDGAWPVSFGLSQEGGSIYFNVSDVTNLVIPEDWIVDYNEEGFSLSYMGALPIYPVGYLPLEISFDSSLTPDAVDADDPYNGLLSGLVTGIVVLDNGEQASSQINESGTLTTPVVGYQQFYFGGPDPDTGELNTAALAQLGLIPQDVVPVVNQISIIDDKICLKLDDIIAGATYRIEYKPELNEQNWVHFRDFDSTELVDSCISFSKGDSPQGYFRVVLPEQTP